MSLRRVIIIASAAVAICLFSFLLLRAWVMLGVFDRSSYISCLFKGGTMVQSRYFTTCEIKAHDAGKACHNNNECSKNYCLYPVPSTCSPDKLCSFPEALASQGGHCDDYTADNNCTLLCYKGLHLDITAPKDKVVCEYSCFAP